MTIRGKALDIHSFSGQRDSSQEEKEKSVNPADMPLLQLVTSCWRAQLSLSTTQKKRAKSSTATCSRAPQVLLGALKAHRITNMNSNETDVFLFLIL